MTASRIALVTGANRGIGREIVRQLAVRGITCVLAARDSQKGAEAAAALAKDGSPVEVVTIDVAAPHSIEAGMAEIDRRFGRLDILVNNAAILIDGPGGFDASLFELSEDTVRQTMATNLLGPLHMIQAAVPLMRRHRYGRIVNVSSSAGQLESMGMGFPAYRISKSALNALTRITAAELKGSGIKVNAACPGWVRTDMGGPDAERSVEEGAETPVWLALLPDNGPSGGFFRDQRPIPW